MAIERWGSLSVADHKDVHALIHNVLLYDRLVFPMYTESEDRVERHYWDEQKWDPDLQLKRRNQLGELAIECAWDKLRRESYKKRYQAALQLNEEANGEMVTRWLLTEDQDYQLPAGVNHADIFVAYNSKSKMNSDVRIEEEDIRNLKEESQVGIMIGQELGIPDINEPEIALRESIALSRDSDFRNKRYDLHNFQKNCISSGIKPKAIVAEMRDLNKELIYYMEKQKIPLIKKTGFFLLSTLVGVLAGSYLTPLAALGGAISIWKFLDMEFRQNIQVPNRLQPVAAFPDIERKIGLKL